MDTQPFAQAISMIWEILPSVPKLAAVALLHSLPEAAAECGSRSLPPRTPAAASSIRGNILNSFGFVPAVFSHAWTERTGEMFLNN